MQMRKLFQQLRNHDLPDLAEALGGPSSRGDLPDLTKQVKDFLDHKRTNRDGDGVDDHLSELLDALENSGGKSAPQPDRTRQNFYQRLQKQEHSGGAGGEGAHGGAEKNINIHLCYICDSRCQSDIRQAYWSSTQAYFDALSASLQDKFNSMTGYNFEMSTQFLYRVNNRLYGQWYLTDEQVEGNSDDTDTQMLATVNRAFWERQNLWGYLLQWLHCDVGIWTISASDNLWDDDYVDSVDGIANMFQICGSESYLTIKLDVNMDHMSSMVGHELGHVCGMYHDGLVDEAFTQHEAFFHSPGLEDLGVMYDDLVAQCMTGNPNCPGGRHNCIMNGVVNTQSVYSNCSRAYFNMFFGLARVLPHSYEDACLPAEGLLLNV